jgi:hypothetical protein
MTQRRAFWKRGLCMFACLAVGNSLVVWDEHVSACVFNNCNHGCHQYIDLVNIFGSSYSCYQIPAGQHWDASTEHVGAARPGGTWNANNTQVMLRIYELCCRRCLPSTNHQEAYNMTNLLTVTTTNQHQCDQG